MRLGAKVKEDNSPSNFEKFLILLNDLIFKYNTEKLLFSLKLSNSRDLASLLDKYWSFTL